MTTQLETDLQTLLQEAQTAIAAAQDLTHLEQLRVNYLGKKGALSLIL
ncbi:MAG: phenylalanine--tRNA ligase subunit alpha, partial [Microcystaceae cyanobacterium]